MNSFTKDKKTGGWAVVGPDVVDARKGDVITVTKKDGTEERATLAGDACKPFKGRFGETEGMMIAIAPLDEEGAAPTPPTPVQAPPTPDRKPPPTPYRKPPPSNLGSELGPCKVCGQLLYLDYHLCGECGAPTYLSR